MAMLGSTVRHQLVVREVQSFTLISHIERFTSEILWLFYLTRYKLQYFYIHFIFFSLGTCTWKNYKISESVGFL